MSKVYETLKKKNDPSVEVYPNIEAQNIPSNAVDTSKINDGAITTNKISDEAVTYNKLESNLKNTINNFNAIYDADLDELSIDNLDVTDDAQIGGNVTIDNDLKVNGRILDSENYEIKGLFNHSISATLKIQDTPATRGVLIHFISSYDDNITTLNELVTELKKKINLPIFDNSNDIMGVLIDVDVTYNELEIFCGDGNGGLTNYIFDSALSMSDDISPL